MWGTFASKRNLMSDRTNAPTELPFAVDRAGLRDFWRVYDSCYDRVQRADATVLPTVVLLDLGLPRIDGLEVLRRIRADERTRLLPVVILTSSKEEVDVVRGYSLGANAYVRKPVDFVEFADAARTLGLFWLLLNETCSPRRGS
jgi:CheY-like chemotaxis protein